MKHALERRILFHNGQTVTMCLPVMNDDRQIPLDRNPELPVKQFFLLLFVFTVPIIIQSDLADRHTFGMIQQTQHLREPLLGERFPILGVPPCREADKVVRVCDLCRFSAAFQIASRIQDPADVFPVQLQEQFIPVAVERIGVVMGMGI